MKKKILTLLLAVVLLTPVVKAADLKTLEIKNDNGTLKYSGTTEDGVLAVSCSLFNSKNDEIDISSNQVNDNKFEGSFVVKEKDTYTIKCADYEGGKIISAQEEVKNPSTGDSLTKSLLLLTISAAGIVITKNVKRASEN